MLPLNLLFNIVLEVLASEISQEKEIKVTQIRKKDLALSLFADDRMVYVENQKEATKNTITHKWFCQGHRIHDQHTQINGISTY